MKSAEKVQIVCFDLGGVLVRICRTWAETCRAAGLPVRGDSAGDSAEIARRELMDLYATGLISGDEWATRLARALGDAYSPRELAAIHDAVTLDEYAEVASVVDEIHAAGLPTACLSNTTHAHWTRLVHHDGTRALPGSPEYPVILRLRQHYASHLFRAAKPHEAIYRAFERASGHAGASVLFFDDLPENIEAARGVGWQAERIDHSVETAPQIRQHLRRYGVV